MAGTYGEPGKNPFALKGIGGVLSPVVNAETGVIQIYKKGAFNTYQSLGTLDPKTNKFSKDDKNSPNLSETEIKALSSSEGINNIKNAAKTATIQGVKAEGKTDAEAQAKANKLISPNSASNPGGQNPTAGTPAASDADKKSFDEEKGTFKEGTREEYGNAIYPLNLKLEHQDCIKFSILKYIPSLEYNNQNSQGDVLRLVRIEDGVPKIGKQILGTITLPIPAGINDNNSVDWQSDTLSELKSAFGSIAAEAIKGGREGAEGAIKNVNFSEKLSDPTTTKGISGLLAGIAVGSEKLQQRSTGTIFNNNLELLFNSPSLRSFSFTFKLSPREPKEAKEVMKIIRFFKQAMSVKRSKSTLLLKTPHTFAISYLTSNQQHPYLNKFKECALTTFNVDYTPEGQYMTYMSSDIQDRSMISYVISMTFQELEPIFDDEYQKEDPVSNIGY